MAAFFWGGGAEGQGLGGTKGLVTMKKNIWVTGQLPTLSITVNGPTHTPPSINALEGSGVIQAPASLPERGGAS